MGYFCIVELIISPMNLSLGFVLVKWLVAEQKKVNSY